jgi:hypothetical protein
LRLNQHIEHDGPSVFAHACRMGLEGIVSKRKASAYRSGRTADWIKSKNPDAPAVKREAEEEWDRWPSKKARPSSRNHGSHSLARMPRPARLLRLWTVPPQRNAERGLAIRRNTSAVSLPTNGLHTLWNDWCRCAPRQGAACQQEACVAAVTGVPSKVPRLARARDV